MQTGIDKTVTNAAVTIADNIKMRMLAINKQLAGIKIYNKSPDSASLKTEYNLILDEINNFFEYVKSEAFVNLDPVIVDITKKQVYELIFSSEMTKNVELLCCAGNLDYDQMLVCARRARLNPAKRDLFLCDLDFIEKELLGKQVKIENVTNLGILHHYAKLEFGVNAEKKAVFDKKGSNNEAENIIEKVFDFIPGLIKNNIKNNDLKVVLRCCSGGEHPKDTINLLKETRAYPVKLLFPSLEINPRKYDPPKKTVPKKLTPEEIQARKQAAQEKKEQINTIPAVASATAVTPAVPAIDPDVLVKINAYRNNALNVARQFYTTESPEKGNICIEQNKTGVNQFRTIFYLPFQDCDPIILDDFPGLTTKENVEEFAKKLILFLQEYQEHPLHINPYDISSIVLLDDYVGSDKKTLQNVIADFKEIFKKIRTEWEGPDELAKPKSQYRKLFTTAGDLKDVAPLPKDSYGEKLLSVIKDDCPNVKVFKVYYAGYKASPERMVHEIGYHNKGEGANYPKAIVVSRDTFWKEEKPAKAFPEEQEQENKSKNTLS